MRVARRPLTAQSLISKRGQVVTYACPRHKVQYDVQGSDDVECPACHWEIVTRDLRGAMVDAKAQVEYLEKELDLARAKVDSLYAMQTTVDLLDATDRTFLKSTLYQWREDKSVTLSVTHRFVDAKPYANGFIAVYRKGSPVGHTCTSIGGVALADYYEQAQRTHGDAQAMSLLARATNVLLSGGVT